MDINLFAVQLGFLFLPGIISFIIVDILTHHKDYKVSYILIYIFVLGFTNYVIYYSLISLYNYFLGNSIYTIFFDNLLNLANNTILKPTANDILFEIINVSIIALFVGIVLAYIDNYELFYKLARTFRVTKKFGDLNVFDRLMKSQINRYVVIRDRDENVVYNGTIRNTQSIGDLLEIHIENLNVFWIENNTVMKKYHLPGIYLLRRKDRIAIEFPLREISDVNMNNDELKQLWEIKDE